MPSSTSCVVSFMCLSLLLLLPAQGLTGRHRLKMWNGRVEPNCCLRVSNATISQVVSKCDIQEKHMFVSCPIDAYILTTQSGTQWCVDPKAKWLPKRLELLKKRGILCYKLGNDLEDDAT